MTIYIGNSTSERINGTSSADTIDGRGGNDVIYGYGGDDSICGGAGADLIYGGGGNDEITGGNGHGTPAAKDVIYGGRGNDILLGEGGNDYLSGGSGADRLNGGAGDDKLIGGSGADLFIFDEASGGPGTTVLPDSPPASTRSSERFRNNAGRHHRDQLGRQHDPGGRHGLQRHRQLPDHLAEHAGSGRRRLYPVIAGRSRTDRWPSPVGP